MAFHRFHFTLLRMNKEEASPLVIWSISFNTTRLWRIPSGVCQGKAFSYTFSVSWATRERRMIQYRTQGFRHHQGMLARLDLASQVRLLPPHAVPHYRR